MPAWLVVLAVLIQSMCGIGPAHGQTPRRVLSVEDLLRSSDIGMTYLTPDGKDLIYEWLPEYLSAPNVYVDVMQRPKFKLFKRELEKSGPGEPLFDQEPGTGYWIGSVSPDGQRLAVYSAEAGVVRAGVYNLTTGEVLWLPFTPEYTFHLQEPTWISATKLAYNVVPEGGVPSGLTGIAAATRLKALWRNTFEGRQPSVTIIRSAALDAERDRRDGNGEANHPGLRRLVVVEALTGGTRELDRGTGVFFNVVASPDARYVAAVKEGPAKPRSPAVPVEDDLQNRHSLRIYSLNGASLGEDLCSGCDVVPGSLKWAADSARVAFIVRDDAVAERARVMQYDLRSREALTVNTAGLKLSCARGSVAAVGSRRDVALFARKLLPGEAPQLWQMYCAEGARYDWYLSSGQSLTPLTTSFERTAGAALTDTDGRLHVVADGDVWTVWKGRAVRERRTSGLSAETASWISDSGQSPLLAAPPVPIETARNGFRHRADSLLLLSANSTHIYDPRRSTVWQSKVPEGPCSVSAISISTQAALHRCEEYPYGATFLLIRGDRAPAGLFELNAWTHQVDAAKVVDVAYQYQGRSMSSCALVPPHQRPGTLAPTIVFAYPNPSGACGNYGFSALDFANMQLLAAQGYVVLYAANPERTEPGELSEMVLAAVDGARAAGLSDPGRVGVYGHSLGYHKALQLLTETSKVKAGIVFNGASDHISGYGSTALLTRVLPDLTLRFGHAMAYEGEQYQDSMGGPPWAQTERYVAGSPVLRADRIAAPLMIVHNDMDKNDIGQSAEIFTALSRLGRKAELVTYWGEGHSLNSPANVRDFWSRVVAWYDEHLAVARDGTE